MRLSKDILVPYYDSELKIENLFWSANKGRFDIAVEFLF